MSSFLKDLKSVGLTKLALIPLGILSSIITARYLGPEKSGVIDALLIYPSIFLTIGSLGIRQSTTYFVGKKIHSEADIKIAISQIWMLTSIISLVCSFFLVRNFSSVGDNGLYLLLVLLPLPFGLFVNYGSGFYLGKNEINYFNKLHWIPALLVLLFNVAFVATLHWEINGALLARLSGPIIMFFLILGKIAIPKKDIFPFKWKLIKDLLSLGMVYAIALAVIALNYKVDVVLLDKLSGSYELGIYSKGANITQYLWQIPALFGVLVFARSSNAKNGSEYSQKVVLLLRLSFMIIFVLSIFLYAISGYLIPFMYGSDFEGSVSVLKILLPGVVLLTIYKVMTMDLAGKGKPWVSIKAMFPALIINIVMNIFLIPDYGADGAAVASLTSYSIAALLFLHFYSKEVDIPVKNIIKYKRSDFELILDILRKLKRSK